MKLAILGIDPEILGLVRAAQAGTEHTLVLTCDVGDAAEVYQLAPLAVAIQDWQALLTGSIADAVLVARGNADERAEQLRKLLAADVPLLVASGVVDSLAVAYELEMIREEHRVPLVPCFSDSRHPAVSRMAELIQQGSSEGATSPLGRVEQLVIERELSDRSKANVVEQFLRDMDLVRSMVGEITQLGAMASGPGDAGYASLGVQLACPQGLLIRWSVGPVAARAGTRFSLIGLAGKAALDIPSDRRPWRLEIHTASDASTVDFPQWNPAACALSRLTDAIAVRDFRPNWMEVCRGLELAEALAQSVRRGRTISLRNEAESEEGAFKGLMAAGGCLVLVVSLLLLVASTALARFVDPRIGQFLIVALVGGFLALQIFKLVVPGRGTEPDGPAPRPSS